MNAQYLQKIVINIDRYTETHQRNTDQECVPEHNASTMCVRMEKCVHSTCDFRLEL